MKEKTKIVCAFAMVAFAFVMLNVSAATPVVTDAIMVQPNVAGRDVTITYTLANAPAVVTLDIQTNAVAEGEAVWVSIGGEHIQSVSAGSDVFRKVEGNGQHTIVWKADADLPGLKIPDARAVVTAWAMNDTPDYMVVDISSSAVAGSQRYYTSTNFLPGGLLGIDDYRTSKIVMRRIHAKNVPWTMGSIIEANRNNTKEYAHAAVLTNDYYLGVFPVTQAQWANVAGYNNSSYKTEDDRNLHPVEMLSYNEIRCTDAGNVNGMSIASKGGLWPEPPYEGSFLDKLNDRTGLDFDLPTEGEWEFACRVGGLIGDGRWNTGKPRLVTGDAADANMPGANKYNGYASTTAVVGLFAPNAWGLYDMHGNVWEWCLDWYVGNTSSLGGAVNIDFDNPGNRRDASVAGTERVQRGGCAATSMVNNRLANRANVGPTDRLKWYGLRLACRAGLK